MPSILKEGVDYRYWDSKFLEHSTHQHLLNFVHEGLKVFDLAKIVQQLMDRSNVNLKLLKKLKEQMSKLESPGLIDFGSCNLHIVHSAFKFGTEASGWNLKKLKLCFQLSIRGWWWFLDMMISLVSQNQPSYYYNSVQPGF